MPQLSIITINLNNLVGLKKTIYSVLGQQYKEFEYIIIDGGSSDGSAEHIRDISEVLTFWVSEKDFGIYNAMNKGIKQATGKYLLFLNSGDELYDKTALGFIKDHKEDLIYFDVEFHSNQTSFVHRYPSKLNFNYFLKYSLPHQAILIKRDLFTKVGLYNENYRIVSDWAFFVDAIFKHGASYKKISKLFARLDRNGISCDPNNLNWIENERISFLNDNYKDRNLQFKDGHLERVMNEGFLSRIFSKFFKTVR